MNALDVVILVLLLVGAWRGFSKGLIREVAQIVGVLLAFFLALQLGRYAGLLAAASLGYSERMEPLVGFVIVFIAALLVVIGLGRLVEYLIGKIKLGPINKALGGALGACRMALIVSVLLVVIGGFGLPGPETRQASLLYDPVHQVVPRAWRAVVGYVPGADRLARQIGLEPAAVRAWTGPAAPAGER